jgi:DNA invertase Pin-like site-specific DNA recombinase
MRCAIYTRKSSEEGLEQSFNSLDAQREACEAYVFSQKHEGWELVPNRYDDGGYSGGDMERPGLKALLRDVEAARVDIVVVYKIDRLTRSLSDFSRIADRFEKDNVSFVAVTQAFNTSTSMGRLMLNVLLSFAQFEREITAERIRDKHAASKAKGLWMGGHVPFGYDAVNNRLVVNEPEARVVRHLFERFLSLKDLQPLADECAERRIYKRYRGHVRGCAPPDTPFARADLRTLLTQPIYVGRVRHKDLIYPAVHEAIIDVPTFDQAARVLSELSAQWRKRRPRPLPYLLQGLLQSPQGEPFTAEHAKHHASGPRFYRFPTTTVGTVRVAEGSADQAVLTALCDFLLNVHRAHEFGTASSRDATVPRLVAKLRSGSREQAKAILHELVGAVYMDHASMRIRVRAAGTGGLLREDTDVNVCLRTKGARSHMRVLTETGTRRPDPSLVRLIGCASAWLDDLVTGRSKSLMAIARREGLSLSHVSNTIELAFLAPDLKQAILEGRQPLGLTVTSLQRAVPLPLSWPAQRRRFTRLA